MRAKLLHVVTAITLSVIFSFPLFAGTTGKIIGKVLDARTREALPGVNIFVENTVLGAVTDINGEYLILRIPPGTYTLRASMIGYTNLRYENVHVSVDKTTEINFQLSQELLQGESVTVVAEKPLVERDLTSTTANISSESISRLPVESMQDVINLQAGVVEGHFRGGRGGEVAYLIDGIPINDVYSGSNAVEVEKNAIQELVVISGTFNAEYGQAMSGVVNIVTKEGSDKYSGRFDSYLGNYASNHSDIFWNIGAINPIYNLEGNLSGPVPLTKKKLTFFASGRFYDTKGAIYGRKVFLPSDSSSFPSNYVQDWYIESYGKGYRFSSAEEFQRIADSLKSAAPYEPMRPSLHWTGQLKLAYRLTTTDKLEYQGIAQQQKYKEYDHQFRFNPDGDFWRYLWSWNNNLSWTKVLNSRSFITLKLARFFTGYKQYVYANPYDPQYQNPDLLNAASGMAFFTGGQQMWHFTRNTTTSLGKLDINSQVTKEHQFKLGIEAQLHRLWLRSFEIRLNRDTDWQPFIPTETKNVQNNDQYLFHPLELSAYLQDKMEFDYMVVNAGVRFDYFDSDGAVPISFLRPATSALRKVKSSQQISPRLGLSYPITDRGAIHVSYGHFFQIPNFEFLYSNPDFELYPTSNYGSTAPPERVPNTIGNADLKPQKTVIYEIGLQQQLSNDIALDVSAYFKDIRNLLGTEILRSITGITYARYINRDYGNVRGVTVSLEKRISGNFGTSVDYTYQIAKGNASDPASAFLDTQAGREPQKELVPLDWDRRHSLNFTVTVGDAKVYSISFIGRIGSGLPYTPTQQNVRTAVENSERRPAFSTFDLYAYRNFLVSGLNLQAFVRIFNLLDQKNELEIYSDTGRANYTLSALSAGTIFGLNSLNEYITRPDFYSDPRQVLVGFSFEF